MAIALEIDSRYLIKALNTMPRKDKIFIAESLEKDLLSEWDEYEESEEVIKRVNESLLEYDKGDVINLKDLI